MLFIKGAKCTDWLGCNKAVWWTDVLWEICSHWKLAVDGYGARSGLRQLTSHANKRCDITRLEEGKSLRCSSTFQGSFNLTWWNVTKFKRSVSYQMFLKGLLSLVNGAIYIMASCNVVSVIAVCLLPVCVVCGGLCVVILPASKLSWNWIVVVYTNTGSKISDPKNISY